MSRFDFDVVIWDSTPAGLVAAVAAARMGERVVVLTEDTHIGGLHTSGLGFTNAGRRTTVSGLAREFHERIRAHYTAAFGQDSQQVRDCNNGFFFEPHVAERVYDDWMAEAGVTILRQTPVDRVRKRAERISAVQTESGRWITGKVFIDASYEGDLIALAGCDCHIGRESSGVYGESLAGVQWPPADRGAGDEKLQPMDYRLCLTDDPANQAPFARPQNYDASRYAWHGAHLRANPPTHLQAALPLNPMPNRKTDSRTGEWVGASWDYPLLTRPQRREVDRAHQHYSAGYIWFLLTEDVLPAPLIEQLRNWGYAADEFVDNDHWPWHVYVREARRLVGDYVMTQVDVQEQRAKDDGVAIGSFFLDVHPVQMLDDPQGAAPESFASLAPEGSIGDRPVKPYDIPYRVLLPKRRQAQNLLSPICSSTSHIAFSTIRMEPVYQMLGHAAGLAGAIAAQSGDPVQDVNVSDLRQRLAAQGQILDSRAFTDWWPGPPHPSGVRWLAPERKAVK